MICTPWATSADALPPLDATNEDVDAGLLDNMMAVASEVLYNLTRQRYPGVCQDKVYPSAKYRAPADAGMLRQYMSGFSGRWAPWGWCTCNRSSDYGCFTVPEVQLPGFPVIAAQVTVKIDGQPFTNFHVRNRRFLVRDDGQGWPCCQNLTLDDTHVGAWSVTYQYGANPTAGGVMAAAYLGGQLYLGVDPKTVDDGRCKLPKRITAITRQGVTAVMIDPLKLFAEGLTGLPVVDQWVQADLIGQRNRPASILVPGRGPNVTRRG